MEMEASSPPAESDEDVFEDAPRHRQMPADLPKSLDDRQPIRSFGGETEMYDAWQGKVRTSWMIICIIYAVKILLNSLCCRRISSLDCSNTSATPSLQAFVE